jgi:16S rRNA (guanine527-N7)-methyltransferase
MRTVKFFRDQEKSFQFFRTFLRENFNLSNPDETENLFSEYCGAILTQNKKFNLTSLTTPEEVYEILFLDSLMPFTFLPGFEKGDRVIDIGCGAGIPGLVLALVFPNTNFWLLDATRKKIQFIEHLVQEFNLKNVFVLLARAEKAGHDPSLRESFDFGLARSLAQLNILFEYVFPFLKKGGYCYAYKGRLSSLEVTRGEGALMEVHGKIEEQKSYLLPFSGKERLMVKVKKTDICSAKYPRRTGIPKKRPL